MQEDILERLVVALRRRRLVFVQVSPVIDRLMSSSSWEQRFHAAAVDTIPTSIDDDRAFALVHPFDAVLGSPDPVRSLGTAREAINSLLDAGHSVCLVSKAPRMAFPTCPGSSLLEDAYVFHADDTSEGEDRWAEEEGKDALQNRLACLGPDVLACLDYLVFDLQVSHGSTGLITPLELEAIRGAGIVAVEAPGDAFTLTPPLARLMPALTHTVSCHLGVQPDFPVVSSGLVEIERRIRRALQKRATEEYGDKWRGAILGAELAIKVADRATQELSRSVTVKGLRSPLEWLTLGELVDLIRHSRWTDRLGRDDRYWQRFATEVMPIRNRLSHMRFLRQQDRGRVEYWKASLARTVG